MFKIVNGAGLELPLPKGFTITLEEVNPLFNSSVDLFQDLSFPGTVPLTPEVERFIGHAQLDETPPSAYRFGIQCISDAGIEMAGNFNCAIRGCDLEFNLELNYAAVSDLVEGVNVTEIRNLDGQVLGSYADYKALMMDTILHPEQYPFCFIPIYNEDQSALTTGVVNPAFVRKWINYFDSAASEFKLTDEIDSGRLNGQQPFFKLTHVIKLLLEYLGFAVEGDFFSEARFANLYIYTRYSTVLLTIYPCMKYMPKMLISDMLKQIRDRFHLTIHFNTATGIATVRSFSAIKNDPDPIDLTPYLAAYAEQEPLEETGYLVTVKSDQQDEAYNTGINNSDQYPPLFKLTAGNGANPIELDLSTLKTEDLSTPGVIDKRYPITRQSVINYYAWNFKLPNDIGAGTGYLADPNETNNWPLRVIRYLGYQALTGGGHWPAAEGVELDEYDMEWYRFLNDSKEHKLTLHLPISIFTHFIYTKKYVYRSKGLNYIEVMVNRRIGDVVVDQDLVKVQFTCRSILNEIATPVTIQPVTTLDPDAPYNFGAIKAYFNEEQHGLKQLSVEVAGVGPNIGAIYDVPVITNPTNARGAGGVASAIVYVSGGDFFHQQAELRIRNGRPKYMERFGIKHDFIWSGSYWYVNIDLLLDSYLKEILDYYWIVF